MFVHSGIRASYLYTVFILSLYYLLIQPHFEGAQRLSFEPRSEISAMISALLISIALFPLLSKVEGSDCEGFRAAACPLTESNILGFDNKQDLASCQRQCQLNSNCNWFTRFLSIKSDIV